MNIPPSEAAKLSLWEYEALLWHWVEDHHIEDGPGGRPDPRTMQSMVDRLNAELQHGG